MPKIIAPIVAACLTCCYAAPAAAAKPLKRTAPTTAPFAVDGENADQLLKRMQGRGGGYPIQYIRYSTVQCDVGPGQRCEGSVTVVAPTGWQVCGPIYTVTYYGGYDKEVRVTPAQFYPNDPQSPDRFSAYEYYIRAGGNGFGLGARVTLSQVGISLIPADMTNYDRYFYKCQMPPHG